MPLAFFVLFMISSSVGVCFEAEKIRSDVFRAGDIEGIICLYGEVLPFRHRRTSIVMVENRCY